MPDKPEWEKEMEDFVNGMSEEEWEQFKIDTEFDFYNSEHFRKMSHLYPQWLQDITHKEEER
jgi:hypothetical protein